MGTVTVQHMYNSDPSCTIILYYTLWNKFNVLCTGLASSPDPSLCGRRERPGDRLRLVQARPSRTCRILHTDRPCGHEISLAWKMKIINFAKLKISLWRVKFCDFISWAECTHEVMQLITFLLFDYRCRGTLKTILTATIELKETALHHIINCRTLTMHTSRLSWSVHG